MQIINHYIFRAFAATGVVETQWAIARNLTSPLQLSVQEFVSCSGNAGCKGGSIKKTLFWLENATYKSAEVSYLTAKVKLKGKYTVS